MSNQQTPLMDVLKFEVRMSVLDIELNEALTDELSEEYYDRIKSIDSVRDVTPFGNFIGEGAHYLRIEVDNRYLTNEKAVTEVYKIINQIQK